MTGTILDQILHNKREEVARRKRLVPLRSLEARIREANPPRPFASALRGRHVGVIAEVKRASPSKGVLCNAFDPVSIASLYDAGGAAAVSVLTDERYFGGTLDHLEQVRTATSRPLLRKDFLVDPYQVYEARAWQADAVLLIVAALDDVLLRELLHEADHLGMAALVEVHTRTELERALACGARIVGINNRDLRTFETRLETTVQLAHDVPPDIVLVSESGIAAREDVERMAAVGADAVLVGESLMRHPRPAQLLRQLASVPRLPGARYGPGTLLGSHQEEGHHHRSRVEVR